MARHILSKSEVAALYERPQVPFREVPEEHAYRIGESRDGAAIYELSETVLWRIVNECGEWFDA